MAVCTALLLIPLLAALLLRPKAPDRPVVVATSRPAPTAAPTVAAPTGGLRLVAGRVADGKGKPIVAADIRIEGSQRHATSTAGGAFTLSGVSLQALTLVVTAAGHERATVRLAAGKAGERERVQVTLRAVAPAGGVVIDPDGKPIAKAAVRCSDRPRAAMLGALSDQQGKFQLPAKAVDCKAVASHGRWASSKAVTLRSGDANTLRLTRGGSIDGDVVDERGQPIRRFRIAIETHRGLNGHRGSSRQGRSKQIDDPRGRFRLDGLPPGRYVLTATANRRPAVQSRSVEIDGNSQSVRIELPQGGVVVGRVITADNKKAVAGATVLFDMQSMTAGAKPVRTGADGSFRLEGAPPRGRFSVSVSARGYNRRIVSGLSMPASGPLRQTIELSSRAKGAKAAEYVGIGAQVGPAPGGVRLGRVFAGGPAQQAGLRRNDVIVGIDGRDAGDLSVSQAIQLLRGQDGTTVRITVLRAGRRSDHVIERRPVDYKR